MLVCTFCRCAACCLNSLTDAASHLAMTSRMRDASSAKQTNHVVTAFIWVCSIYTSNIASGCSTRNSNTHTGLITINWLVGTNEVFPLSVFNSVSFSVNLSEEWEFCWNFVGMSFGGGFRISSARGEGGLNLRDTQVGPPGGRNRLGQTERFSSLQPQSWTGNGIFFGTLLRKEQGDRGRFYSVFFQAPGSTAARTWRKLQTTQLTHHENSRKTHWELIAVPPMFVITLEKQTVWRSKDFPVESCGILFTDCRWILLLFDGKEFEWLTVRIYCDALLQGTQKRTAPAPDVCRQGQKNIFCFKYRFKVGGPERWNRLWIWDKMFRMSGNLSGQRQLVNSIFICFLSKKLDLWFVIRCTNILRQRMWECCEHGAKDSCRIKIHAVHCRGRTMINREF